MCWFLRRLFRGHPTGWYVPPADPAARDFINQMKEAAAPFTGRRTVALYGADGRGRPYVLGSGVPLELVGKRFVVTAAHVLDRVLDRKEGVYLSPGVAGGQLIDINGCQVNRTAIPVGGVRQDDPFDLCLIGLTDRVAAAIGPGVVFVRPDQIEYDGPAQTGAFYFLHGFPQENVRVCMRKRTVRCRSLPYGSILYDGSRGEWPVPPRGDYIDLDFDPTKSIDDRGRTVRTPNPKGISGCGIWRLCPAGVNRSEWSEADIRLVAIEHRWHGEKHILRGTLFAYVNQIVGLNYPDIFRQTHEEWLARQRRARPADGWFGSDR